MMYISKKAIAFFFLSLAPTTGAVSTTYSYEENGFVTTKTEAEEFCRSKGSKFVEMTPVLVCPPTQAPVTVTPAPTDAPTEAPVTVTDSPTAAPGPGGALCSKPDDCHTQSCAFESDLPVGYYPDPNDCRSYCYTTSTTAPSRYETVTGFNMIYDPWGRSYWKGPASYKPITTALGLYDKVGGDPAYKVPLAGMNGGMPNWNYNNPESNRDYCGNNYDPNNWRTKSRRGRRLNEPIDSPAQPEERQLVVGDGCQTYYDVVCDKTPIGSSGGDPHFTLWSGQKFDFHGGCDLVLLHHPEFADGLGLDVHVRTKIDTWWSFIESAAIRIGDHTLEITGGIGKIPFWIDGVETSNLVTGEATLGDFPVKFNRINDHQSRNRIDLGNGSALSIETYKRFVRVNAKLNEGQKFVGIQGMLGSHPDGQMLARDKKTLLEDPIAFGQEWQVLATEPKLFHAESTVQHPMKCELPSEVKKSQMVRRLQTADISEKDASLACARVPEAEREACMFDVLATQDKGMAGSY